MVTDPQTSWMLTIKERDIWWREPEYEWYHKVLYVGFEQLVVLGVIPLFLLVYYNSCIYAAFQIPQDIEIQAEEEIRRRSREKKLSKVLMFIVMVFLFCNSSRIMWFLYYSTNYDNIIHCPKLFPGKSGERPWGYILALIYEMFLVINSSVNTIVYFLVNNKFRYKFLRICNVPLRYISQYMVSTTAPPNSADV